MTIAAIVSLVLGWLAGGQIVPAILAMLGIGGRAAAAIKIGVQAFNGLSAVLSAGQTVGTIKSAAETVGDRIKADIEAVKPVVAEAEQKISDAIHFKGG